MTKHVIFAILALAAGLTALAAEPADSVTIADRINAAGQSAVHQPRKLNERLVREARESHPAEESAKAATSTGGYRIQVFSGNNARTSKGEAGGRAAKISAQFPEYETYVTYDAPYWRLKVGDFPSYEEARAALGILKEAFPAYSREMRLVRDRIKTN